MPLSQPTSRILEYRDLTEQDPDNVWEIDAPPKRSLYWSIMIPYLIKSAENRDFINGLYRIIGDEKQYKKILAKRDRTYELNLQRIETRVKNINPFKNAHTLYSDKDLSNIMQIFKVRLNQFANKLKTRENIFDYNLKLEAASNELQCQIELHEESKIRHFEPCTAAESSRNLDPVLKIVIFRYSSASGDTYRIGLDENNSLHKQKSALKHILEVANVSPDWIREILNLVPCNHFLLGLIGTPWRDVIPILYESHYVLIKMMNAGFDIDPLANGDDGFSAFYHCIVLNDWKLFTVLYKHVIEYIGIEDKEDKYRDTEVLSRLELLRDRIEKDCLNSQNFSDLGEGQTKALHMVDQMKRFNKYQCEIMEKTISIKENVSIEEEKRQKDILASILKKYDEYFYYDYQNENNQQLQNFLDYYEYHMNLDNFTSTLFFEHFLRMKLQIDDTNKHIFTDAISLLFLTLISKMVFSRSEDSNISDSKADLLVAFCYRWNFKQALKPLSDELKNSSMGIILSEDIVRTTLAQHPLLNEEFQLSRLKFYLKTAGTIRSENSPIKAALAIERILQVVGEVLCGIKEESVVTSLLRYCLPSGLENEFRNIRNNCFSHYRASSIQGRKELEKGKGVINMQNELKYITDIYEPVFIAQQLMLKDYLMACTQKLKTFPGDLIDQIRDAHTNIRQWKINNYKIHKNKYRFLTYTTLRRLSDNLKNGCTEKGETIKSNSKSLKFLLEIIAECCDNSSSSTFKHILLEIDLLFIDTTDEIESEMFKSKRLDILDKLKAALGEVFPDDEETNHQMDFPELNKVYKNIKDYDFFTIEEKKLVRKGFSDYLKEPRNARLLLIEHFNDRIVLTSDEITQSMGNIFASKKMKQSIKKQIKEPKKVLDILEGIKDNVEEILGNEDETCYMFMSILGEEKFWNMIPNLLLPRSLHDQIANLRNQKLDFVIDRMKLLEEILINDVKFISNFRKFGTSPKGQIYTKRLLRQRYMKEMDTRAALEMLLFDCLGIFKGKEDFEDLWIKQSNLFAGIDLRNYLSHGSLVFETVNDVLDRDDLPGEFINITLKLIEDGKSLNAISELWKKRDFTNIKELENYISNKNTTDDHADLKTIILKCDRWKSYLTLLSKK